MNQREFANRPASVMQRLKNYAKEKKVVDFNRVLDRYALERILYRVSCSSYKNDFILKGAMLFNIWFDSPHRITRDADFLSFGDFDVERMVKTFCEICALPDEESGLDFLPDEIKGEQIKANDEFKGVRLKFIGYLGKVKIPVQIDIGFGDMVVPEPSQDQYPTLLDFSPPQLLVYPKEAVIAEKCHAMVERGMENSRMKDFFDMNFLASHFAFEGSLLSQSIKATFSKRTQLTPGRTPIALTYEFVENESKQIQWKAFVRNMQLDINEYPLEKIIDHLKVFLLPIFEAVANNQYFERSWQPGEPGRWF